MEHKTDRDKAQSPIKTAIWHAWIWLVGNIDRAIKDFETKKNVQQSKASAEEITADATKWMMRFTLVLAVVAVLTLIVLVLQLKEIHDGGKDTHDLAVAAGTQAIQNQSLILATAALADRMKEQAHWTQQMANDNGQMLRGTQAALVDFAVNFDAPHGEVDFSGDNSGKVDATNVEANLVIAVKDWPTKKTRVGPFRHHFREGLVRPPTPGGKMQLFMERAPIPITPQVAEAIKNGQAYVTVEWEASYDNGFGERLHRPFGEKTACKAFISVGYVKCPRFDGGFGGETTCDSIETFRNSKEAEMRRAQKDYCQNPN